MKEQKNRLQYSAVRVAYFSVQKSQLSSFEMEDKTRIQWCNLRCLNLLTVKPSERQVNS